MKKSKLQRKYVNSMRSMSDIPWPARRFRIAPTFAQDAQRQVAVGQCARKVGEQKTKKRRLSRAQTTDIVCGGRVMLKRGSLGRRRVFCESCRERKAQRKAMLRMQQRVSRLTPHEQAKQERRETSRFRRFSRRAG